jgi:arylsulfatase B
LKVKIELQPLFLYLAHLAVHSANQYDPLQTTKRYYDRFPNIDHKGRRLFAGIRRLFARGFFRMQYPTGHLGMVAGLDESVGRIHRALKSSGMDKNSIIVFTTDNGGPAASFDDNYANNWPLRGVKDTLWEGGVRGSAFLWSPLLKNVSRVSNQMMHISDWVPTLLSASGLKNTEISGTGRISSLGN